MAQLSRILAVQKLDHHITGDTAGKVGVVMEKALTATQKRLHRHIIIVTGKVGLQLHVHPEARGIGGHPQEPGPLHTVHDGPHSIAARHPKDLPKTADGAHGIEVIGTGRLHLHVLLGHQKDHPVGAHGGIQGRNADGSLHVKVQRRAREY